MSNQTTKEWLKKTFTRIDTRVLRDAPIYMQHVQEVKEDVAAKITELEKQAQTTLINELEHWASFFEDHQMNAKSPSQRLRDRIDDIVNKGEK